MVANSAELHVKLDEPAAIGHFPGNPIVPGAVLLREVMRIVAANGEATCCEIRSARFLQPVRPGDRLTVSWNSQTAGDVAFTCSTGTAGSRVMSGTIRMRTR